MLPYRNKVVIVFFCTTSFHMFSSQHKTFHILIQFISSTSVITFTSTANHKHHFLLPRIHFLFLSMLYCPSITSRYTAIVSIHWDFIAHYIKWYEYICAFLHHPSHNRTQRQCTHFWTFVILLICFEIRINYVAQKRNKLLCASI